MKNFLLLILLSPIFTAQAAQNHAAIHQVVEDFIVQQTSNINGKVSYHIEPIESRVTLSDCSKMEAFLPAGAQLAGRTSVGVRCLSPKNWDVFVLAQIKFNLNLITSSRALSREQVISEGDITTTLTEVARPIGLTDPEQVLGKVLKYNIAAGQIIREEMLRQPFSVTQGQTVSVILQGEGFNIRSEGIALGNASAGQTVQIKTNSGKVVSGTAMEAGEVWVKF